MIPKPDFPKVVPFPYVGLAIIEPESKVECFVLSEMFYGGGYISAQHRTQPGLAGTYVLF